MVLFRGQEDDKSTFYPIRNKRKSSILKNFPPLTKTSFPLSRNLIFEMRTPNAFAKIRSHLGREGAFNFTKPSFYTLGIEWQGCVSTLPDVDWFW